MARYALTEAGVASKLSEIYALSDPALALKAAAIKADFRDWMDDNFNLTTPQSTFITGMGDEAVQSYGEMCSMCFLHRLDIDFVYPSPPVGAIGKWVESEDKAKVRTDGSGNVTVTGSATFTVGYIV